MFYPLNLLIIYIHRFKSRHLNHKHSKEHNMKYTRDKWSMLDIHIHPSFWKEKMMKSIVYSAVPKSNQAFPKRPTKNTKTVKCKEDKKKRGMN